MEDISVTVTILDLNNEDVSEECEAFDLDKNDDYKCTVDFDLQNENPDEESYTLQIEVEGEAKDGTQHRTVEEKSFTVKREKHKIIISRTAIGSSELQCLRQTTLQVTVENTGKNDEDDVEIKVSNSALGVDLTKDNIQLDKFSSSDNDYRANFDLDQQNAAPGTYPLKIEVYRDGSVEDSMDLPIQVKSCTTEAATTPAQVRTVGENLVGLIQEQLGNTPAPSSQVSTTEPVPTVSFRESRTYVTLLGLLVALMVIAVIMAVVVVVARKK